MLGFRVVVVVLQGASWSSTCSWSSILHPSSATDHAHGRARQLTEKYLACLPFSSITSPRLELTIACFGWDSRGDSRGFKLARARSRMSVPEETSASRYVKLNKEHEQPVEEIRPGELNQPVYVPQLVVHRCNECGQPLPESYEPPGTEPWTSGIFGCADDVDSCKTGLFCPCVLFGRNVENLKEDIPWTTPCICHGIFVEGGIALGAATVALHGIDPSTAFLVAEGLLFAWWMCGIYTGLVRQELQKKYHLQNAPCDPCMVHCCLHWCAICQEHREMQGRLSDNVVMPMTVINPPPQQQMNANDSATVSHKEDAEIQIS